MNREIKFRAWRENKMHYNITTAHYEHNAMSGSSGDLWDFAEWMKWSKVMQYTGMKDKNGKDIYEGDILEIWDGRKLPVEFGEYFTGFERRDSHNGWYLASNKAISDIALDERYAVEEYGVTVVGNIFENHELLEA